MCPTYTYNVYMITVSHTKCILYVYYVCIYLYDFETFFNASSSQTQLRSHHKKHKSVVESQKKENKLKLILK